MTNLVCFTPQQYAVRVSVQLDKGILQAVYDLTDVPAGLVWPEASHPPKAVDGLFRTTCCELFVGLEGEKYLEINASPSGDWQYYWFDGYRKPTTPQFVAPPTITFPLGHLSLALTVSLGHLAALPTPLSLGISVVADFGNRLDYWALRHTADQPDFHRRDSFIAL